MIKFEYILYPFLLFILFFLLHVIVWRIVKPKKHIISIVAVFGIVPAVLFIAAYIALAMLGNRYFSLLDFLLTVLLYFGLAGCYIQTYPAVQAWSPSLYIAYMLGRSAKGLSLDDIKEVIHSDNLIEDRFNDLIEEGMIGITDDESIRLTAKGRLLSSVFVLYRKLLGLRTGEG